MSPQLARRSRNARERFETEAQRRFQPSLSRTACNHLSQKRLSSLLFDMDGLKHCVQPGDIERFMPIERSLQYAGDVGESDLPARECGYRHLIRDTVSRRI